MKNWNTGKRKMREWTRRNIWDNNGHGFCKIKDRHQTRNV